jgi:cyclophilin family peptidyl-prolyl cis-trans isomerase
MHPLRPVLLLLLFAVGQRLQGQPTSPAITAPLPSRTLQAGGEGETIDLRAHFGLPGISGPIVQFDTVVGRAYVELQPAAAPRHVSNFLAYVDANAYSNTFIHRAAALEGTGVSIIQGGGYITTSGSNVADVPKRAPVALEYGLPNARGTLAAARTSDINSATSEWYFNVKDNSTILGPSNGGGYSVFGRVIGNGMTVIDAIAGLQRVNAGSVFTDLPVRSVPSGSITSSNLVVINGVSRAGIYPGEFRVAIVSFSAASGDPAVVEVRIEGRDLVLLPGGAGSTIVSVTASDGSGGSVTTTMNVAVTGSNAKRAPVITTQPPAVLQLPRGASSTLALTVGATGSPEPSFQWRRDGQPLAGATNPTLVLPAATQRDAGIYLCAVTNSNGIVLTQPAVVSFISASPAETGRLINLSILSILAPGEQMTMGTVLGGAGTGGTKALLARVAGPSLAQLGVTQFMPDPQMALVRAGGPVVASNDNWGGDPALATAFSAVGAFPYASAASRDAAIYQPALAAGGYTVELGDRAGSPGFAIAELYDSTPKASFTAGTPRLVNVSVRRNIPEGSPLVAGFYIDGTTSRTVLIRAIGPGLAVFGVPETMPDPELKLLGANSAVIAANDNWGGTAQLTATGAAVGAFAVSNPASNDAMLLITLPPGKYTTEVIGRGAGGAALVEVYEVP